MTTLVCGASGAIGSALAGLLRARGSTIVGAGRSVEQQLAHCDSAIAVDFAKVAEIGSALAALPKDLKGVAFCVGSAPMKPLRATTPGDLTQAFDLNAVAAVETIKAAAPALKANGGSVVLFSSIAVQHGFTNHAIIAAAKGAVEGITKSLAADLAPAVRVNSNEKIANAIASAHPIPRLGAPHDAAALADFLLSDQASWITGQVFGCDGGRSSILR